MSSGSLRVATSETGGDRAFRPGPRTALAMVIIAVIVVAAVLVIALSSGGKQATGRLHAATKYGHLPSWLPDISNGAEKLEVARPASPVLHEEQGYTVQAELPHGATNITA